MITDEALQAAAEAAGLALAESLERPDPQQPPYTPGAAFRKNIRRLSRSERHPVLSRTLPRVAAVVLALLVMGGGWLTVDAEARGVVVSWVRSITQDHISYRFLNADTQQTLPTCTVTWLPEGFEEEDAQIDEQFFNGFYTCEEDAIIIDVSLYHSGTALFIYGDQEYAEDFYFHGYPARYIPADASSSFNSLVWLDEDAEILFSIGSTLEKDVILHIAEGINLLK